MSSKLYWRPRSTSSMLLSDDLKKILARKFWDHDGSLSNGPMRMNNSHLEYLCGLRDAGVEDAQKLIDGIEKFDLIEVWIDAGGGVI